jgi:hypothetical protein
MDIWSQQKRSEVMILLKKQNVMSLATNNS